VSSACGPATEGFNLFCLRSLLQWEYCISFHLFSLVPPFLFKLICSSGSYCPLFVHFPIPPFSCFSGSKFRSYSVLFDRPQLLEDLIILSVSGSVGGISPLSSPIDPGFNPAHYWRFHFHSHCVHLPALYSLALYHPLTHIFAVHMSYSFPADLYPVP
jgi:hypothetical protein